ncbi:MAG: phosphate regulon transcriptional regulator PhoB [Gammaproteobacteria bacterium]
MPEKILIVDDEPSLRQMLGFALMGTGFTCVEAADAAQAETIIAADPPDLILLDWMLPGVSGADLARRLRRDARTRRVPIIMLTARGEERDKVNALEAGADDYVTKPFSTRELVARIKAVLRRSEAEEARDSIEIGGLRLDVKTHRVTAREMPLDLSPLEFRMLHFFITHPERVYTRSQLLDQVWGDNVYIDERTVDVHIRRLRKAMGRHGYDRFIQTVRSVGYRFSTQPG